MSGKWSDYQFKERAKITERYRNLVVYRYYDSYFEEERYAVVLEGVIMVNSRNYPGNEIHSIADIYGGLLGRRRAC